MAEQSKYVLISENNASFPNNNTGFISPELLRTFNQNMIDSNVNQTGYTEDSASTATQLRTLTNASSSFNSDINLLESTASYLNTTFSTSVDLRLDSLEAFSASVIFDFIDTAELNAATASLSASLTTTINGKLNTSSYQIDSASVDFRLDALESFSTSLDLTYAKESELNASSSTLQANIDTKLDTASFNTYSASAATTLVNYSSSAFTSQNGLSSSVANTITSLSASNATTDNTQTQNILIASQSAVGAFASASAYSASLQTSITNLSSSNYQTDLTQSNNLTALSQSNYLTDVTQSNNLTIVSASAWGSFQSASAYSASAASQSTFISASNFSTYAKLSGGNSFVGSQSITGSIAITGSINVLSGSFSGSVVTNVSDTFTTTPQINTIVTLTANEYSGLATSSANTLYIII
jgi:hypothetical protein